MGAWSVAILDSGVVNSFETAHGASLYDWNFYYGNGNTDGGRAASHGTTVAQAIEQTNASLERLDLQISSYSGFISSTAIDSALNRLITLHDQGWHIGAVNLSWGGSFSSFYLAEIDALAARGVFGVAAAGNGGIASRLEAPWYPAALGNVIAVGSHDGAGNPTAFSQNHPSYTHVLADGEGYPAAGSSGTSFSAPQVAAGVATVQALANAALERHLTFGETVDVLQQGGGAALSNPDPANGVTRYYLFDHARSVDYFLGNYLDPEFSPYEYMASFGDIEAVFGSNPGAARAHFIDTGVYEGREVTFDGLEYIASHADLIQAFGTNRGVGALHYLGFGRLEGRATTFDGEAYLATYADLRAAFGNNVAAATRHYINHGFYEGRAVSGPVSPSSPAVSEGAVDLPAGTSTAGYVGVGQTVTGTISSLADRDWFRTDLSAGQTVVIEARGSASGGGTLYDPDLYLRNSNGSLLAYNWDSGAGLDSRLVYTPSQSGTYFLDVDGYSSSTGSYTLSVVRLGASGASALMAAGDDVGRLGLGDTSVDLAWLPEHSSSVDGIL